MTLTAPSPVQSPDAPNDRLLGGRAASLAAHRARYPQPPAPRRGGRADLIAALPPRCVAGEEHALVSWVDGGLAKPTYGRVYEAGIQGRPTLVDNAETLAHLAQIACFGPDWFRRIGTVDEPGTMLCTVSGA